jgi:phosphohistidine swiveling domain-containing protein
VDYVTVDRFTTGSSAVIDTIGLTPVVKGVQAATNNLLLLSELVITASGGVV